MIQHVRLVFLCIMMIGAVASGASAQDTAPAEEGRFRLGPLRFTPSIALSNLGVDDNVFNDDLDPKQDTTAALGPAVKLSMHVGRSRITGQVSGQYLYFHRYANQRSWSTTDELKWEFPLGRITPFISGNYANTRERAGFEIDSRAHMRAGQVRLGTEVRFSGVTSLVLSGGRSSTAFDVGETFLGADLADALNGTTQSEALQLRVKLTPLTTLVLASDAVQDRFTFNQIRNANSIRVLPGFELKPSALVSGKIFVGFRRFDALNTALPDYSGPVAAVDAAYVAGPTKLAFRVSRDLSFSFEETDPYYTLTDLTLNVTERVTQSWDIVARGGRQTLGYKRLASVSTAVSPRTDIIREYGGGLGYRVGHTLRLGFEAIYYRRNSAQVAGRDFKGLRYGASFTYGLPQ